MGAPIWINNNKDLWISNGMKDAFCRVLTTVATLEGRDVMAVYTDAPGVAGTYAAVWVLILTSSTPILVDRRAYDATLMSVAHDCQKSPTPAA